MTVTINYTAFLLTVVGGVAVAAVIYFMIVLARINRAVGRLDTTIDRADELLGSLKSLAEAPTTTVVSARHLIEEGQHVVADFSLISARMRDLSESDASRALSLIERLKSFVAIFASVKTAFASVKHFMERRRHHAGENAVDY
jgi:hypothetical protein